MPTELLVLGAGGHAKVVVEAVLHINQDCHIVLVDQDISKVGQVVLGKISIEYLENWAELPEHCHVALGGNQVRQRLSIVAQEQGKQIFTVVHPDASVSPSAFLGGGSFVAAKAVVSSETCIEEGCIINHAAVIDHDCRIGAYSHVAPGATLGGGVCISSGVLIGSGAVILPGIRIGEDAVVGAGAVVTSDVKDRVVVAGVPARAVRV